MSRRIWVLLGALMILATGGCARIAVHYESTEGFKQRTSQVPTRIVPEQEKPILTPGKKLEPRTYSMILFGLKPLSSPVDLSHSCPQGWGEFTTRVSGLQAVLHALTLNLYSPWTVETSCRATVTQPEL